MNFIVSFVSRAGAVALAFIIASGTPLPLLSGLTAQGVAIAADTTLLKAEAVNQSVQLTDNVTKTILSNGLTVLTKEVQTAPVVSVQVWYRVGSRNERPGITGISHQLEHLMFKGTKDRPIQFGRLFSALGSSSNAFTSYDMTAYVGTVGSEKLEALLALEADRMVNTLAGPSELKSEKTVVLSELDGGNNNPSTRLYRAVMQAAFPNSSYGWPVVGYRSDVEKFTVEAVRDYYKTYYRPENATLVVVGNFDTNEVLNKIKNTFGKITAPPKPDNQNSKLQTPNPKSQTPNPKLIVLREPGSASLLQAVYPTLPPITHPDVAAIDVMDAVLTSGRSSRLYQSLIQTGLASNVGGNASTAIDPGWYIFSATAAQGKSLKEIDRVIQAEVAKLQAGGITNEELERSQTQLRASYILGNREINAQATQLGYNQTVAGDYRFSDRYLEAVKKVTVADVQRVAKQYLDPNKRVLGFFEPTVVTAPTPQTAGTTHTESFKSGKPVDPSEVARYLPKGALQATTSEAKEVKPEKFTLPNGLTVLLLKDRSSPAVTIVGQITAGTGFDRDDKAGLAALTAQNLMNGTKTKDANAIAATLESRGASLGFSASREATSVGAASLSADLPLIIKQMADVLQNATFPENELELNRQRNLVSLKAELDSPGSLARRRFQQKLYPKGHPFHSMRTESSLKGITRADLVNFYQTYYRPDTTTLTLFGDFDPVATKALITRELGSWQSKGQPPSLKYLPVQNPKTVEREQLILAGKSQAVTIMGHPGIARRDPRYYAALLLNQVLGGDTLASRLGTEIRDRQGLTYGIYSVFQAGQTAGPFAIQMQTSAKDNQKAIDETLVLFKEIRDKGITQAELDAAKANLINNFPVELADPDNLANAVLGDEVYSFPMGDFYKFPDKIRAVTLDEVNRVARELLFPNNLLVVTVTPKDKK